MGSKSDSSQGEAKWHLIDGVQVYARRDDRGRPARADAIDEDKAKIMQLADRLQQAGFGVQREKNPRAGRIYHRMNAIWVGEGDPPEDPFSELG